MMETEYKNEIMKICEREKQMAKVFISTVQHVWNESGIKVYEPNPNIFKTTDGA